MVSLYHMNSIAYDMPVPHPQNCQGVLAKDHNKVGHARAASGSTGCDVVD